MKVFNEKQCLPHLSNDNPYSIWITPPPIFTRKSSPTFPMIFQKSQPPHPIYKGDSHYGIYFIPVKYFLIILIFHLLLLQQHMDVKNLLREILEYCTMKVK